MDTKCAVTLVLALGACTAAYSQQAAPEPGPPRTSASIPYATVQVVDSTDSPEVVAEKAAKVLPRPNQTQWMRLERTFFIHLGPNTFRGVEWGSGREEPSIFNPTALDANQWLDAIRDAGGKMVIPVCKHHDGLCLWPSRYTTHSIAASPWLGGKGDMIRLVAEAAHARDIKMGVYLSPADLYQLRTNPTNPVGYYGNGSPRVRSVIPTDPAAFKTDPSIGRTPPAGFKSYTYEVDDYNRYYLNQLYELFTEYGPIYEINIDGANPDRTVPEAYEYAAWYDLIHQLAPQAVISVKGPDSRWVGNEGGSARTTEWSVIPLPKSPDSFTWPDMTARDLGSRSKLIAGSSLWWYPAETNTTILNGWFWAPRKPVRTAAQLVDVYYQSVGRNSNMLLNLSPDNRGLVPDNQVANLHLMGQVIDETFAKNLATGGTLTADSFSAGRDASMALDGNLDTWWEAGPAKSAASLTLKMPTAVSFDVISLQEAVDHRGQRIETFTIDTWNGSDWTPCQWTRGEATKTVGRKRLLRLQSPVTTEQVRIQITGSRLEPTLAEVGLFKQAEMIQPPVISDRDDKGSVSISSANGLAIVYTTDGTSPTAKSAVYRSPLEMANGGTVNAASVGKDGRVGMIGSKYISGYAPIGWKVVAVDGRAVGPADTAAANAIDGKASTIWEVTGAALPHSLTVDMGHELTLAGFSYLPRQDRNAVGVVDSYKFETSTDAASWSTAIDQGRFGNIRNNPVLQEVSFKEVSARYFRFTALRAASGNDAVSIAELTVLPAQKTGE